MTPSSKPSGFLHIPTIEELLNIPEPPREPTHHFPDDVDDDWSRTDAETDYNE